MHVHLHTIFAVGQTLCMSKKLIAEFIGTFILVFVAVGAAVTGIGVARDASDASDFIVPASGTVGVALAFGLVLVFLVYAIGGISGCHVNPAVTVGLWINKKIPSGEAVAYIVAQVLGAILGAFFLWLLVNSFGVVDTTGGLGTNAYGDNISMGGAFFWEAVATAIFVFIILMVTDKYANAAFAGLAIGVALTTIHIMGIALTGTSVNPARSLGPALFAGGEALSQVWLFILAPLVGGIIGGLVWMVARQTDAPAEDLQEEPTAA